MVTMLNRATKKVCDAKLKIVRVDLQVDCLQEVIIQKQEEALAIENEIAILQSKHQGIQEILNLVIEEHEKRLATLVDLKKKEPEEE